MEASQDMNKISKKELTEENIALVQNLYHEFIHCVQWGQPDEPSDSGEYFLQCFEHIFGYKYKGFIYQCHQPSLGWEISEFRTKNSL